MRLAKILTAAAAVSMATAPVVAAPAAKLSLIGADVRASTEAGDSNAAVGGVIIPVIAIVALIGGAVILSDNNDEPTSP